MKAKAILFIIMIFLTIATAFAIDAGTILNPSNNSIINENYINISWNNSQDTNYYNFSLLNADNSFNKSINVSSNITYINYTITNTSCTSTSPTLKYNATFNTFINQIIYQSNRGTADAIYGNVTIFYNDNTNYSNEQAQGAGTGTETVTNPYPTKIVNRVIMTCRITGSGTANIYGQNMIYNYNNPIIFYQNTPIGDYKIRMESYNESEYNESIYNINIQRNNIINITVRSTLNSATILSTGTLYYTITHSDGTTTNGSGTGGSFSIPWIAGTSTVSISGTDIVPTTTLITSTYGTNYYNISTYPGQVVLLATRDMFTNALINNVSINLSGSATYNWLINGTQNYTEITVGGYNVQIGKTGYTSFTDSFTVSRTALVNKTYYLTSNGQNTIFYVKNIYDQYLEGAIVNISRSSDQTQIYSKTTDGVGSVLFVLDPSISYLVTANLNGYNSYSGLITPSTNSFTLTLGTTQTSIPDYYTGINNIFSPTGNLQNNTNYNLTATYTSTDWNITNCYLQISYLNNTIINTTTMTTCDDDEGEGTITFNTGNNTYIQLTSIYTINATNTTDNTTYSQNISYKKLYRIYNYYEGDYSLFKAIKNTKNFDGSGFGDTERIMIAFIIIFSITITAMRRSVNKYVNSGNLLILVALLVFTMSFLELMTINFINGSGAVNDVMNQYGIALIIGLLALFTAILNREEEK